MKNKLIIIFIGIFFFLSFTSALECNDVQSINDIPCEVRTLQLNCSTDATITSNLGTYNMALNKLLPACTFDCVYNFTWLNKSIGTYKIETCDNKYAMLSVIRNIQPQDCPANNFVYSIDDNGTIRCLGETDPLWSANLTNFNLCPTNYFAVGIYGNGSIKCVFSNYSLNYNMSSPFYDWLNRDVTGPTITIIQPANLASLSFPGYISVQLSTSINDTNNVSSTWYVFNDVNTTFYNNSANIHIEQADGTTKTYTLRVYANDSLNNIGLSLITFTVTQTAQPMGQIFPAPENLTENVSTNITKVVPIKPKPKCSLSSIDEFTNCITAQMVLAAFFIVVGAYFIYKKKSTPKRQQPQQKHLNTLNNLN